MKRNDLILLFVILVIACVLYMALSFGRNVGSHATITIDGKEKYTYSLNENMITVVQGYGEGVCTVEIKDGRISVQEANCPDHSCVNQGWIDQEGDTIACLPSRILIVVDGEENSQFDSVSK